MIQDLSSLLGEQRATGMWLAIRFSWLQWRTAFVVHVLLTLSTIAASTVWGFNVGRWLTESSADSRPSMVVMVWSGGFYLLAEMVFSFMLLKADLLARTRFWACASGLLASISRSETRTPGFHRLISRDVPALVELVLAPASLTACALAIASGFVAMVWYIGSDAWSTLVIMGLAVLLTASLARAGSRAAKRVVATGAARVELVSKWIASGPALLSWRRADVPLRRIESAARKEISAKNVDSLIRSAETYLGAFGIALPIAGALAAMGLTGRAFPGGILEFAWALLPFVVVTLSLTRHCSDTVQQSELLEHVRGALCEGREATLSDPREVVLNDDWDVLEGTLLHNVDPSLTANRKCISEILGAVHLSQELGSDPTRVRLSGGGADISAGQKARILLARSLLESKRTDRPLRIECNLNCLDAENLGRVVRLAGRMRLSVSWPAAVLDRAQTTAPSFAPEKQKAAGSNPILGNASTAVGYKGPADSPRVEEGAANVIWRWTPRWAVGYILPAAATALLPFLAAVISHDPTSRNVQAFALTTCSGILLSIVCSYGVEWIIRRRLRTVHQAFLSHVERFEPDDFRQTLVRDFDIATTRLTYYLNDMAWILACGGVSAGMLLWAFGLPGAAASVVMVLLYAGTCRRGTPKVIATRQALPQAANNYLKLANNLSRLEGLPRDHKGKIARRFAYRSTLAIWRKQRRALQAKGRLMCQIRGLAALSVCGAAVMAVSADEQGMAVAALGALLGISASASTLVQAMTGFTSQLISLHRLEATGSVAPRDIHVSINDASIRTSRVSEGARWGCHTFQRGAIVTLAGPSGAGKSRLLTSLCHSLNADATTRGLAYLFPRQSRTHLEQISSDVWTATLHSIVDAALETGAVVVAFDETFHEMPVYRAMGILDGLRDRLRQANCTCILVDHRFSVGELVTLKTMEGPGGQRSVMRGSACGA